MRDSSARAVQRILEAYERDGRAHRLESAGVSLMPNVSTGRWGLCLGVDDLDPIDVCLVGHEIDEASNAPFSPGENMARMLKVSRRWVSGLSDGYYGYPRRPEYYSTASGVDYDPEDYGEGYLAGLTVRTLLDEEELSRSQNMKQENEVDHDEEPAGERVWDNMDLPTNTNETKSGRETT